MSVILFLAAGVTLAAPAAKRVGQGAAASPGTFGEFSIGFFDRFTISSNSKTNATVADLNGPQLSITSPRYTIKAPKIHLEGRKGGKPARLKVTDALATGGVHVVSRNPKVGQTITLDGDKAVYHASPDPNDRGRLEVTGHVHSVYEDPAFSSPVVQNSETAVLTFPDTETTVLDMTHGGITGTAREPEPKSKKK